jgi:predicted nuclease with TOPRIM domain
LLKEVIVPMLQNYSSEDIFKNEEIVRDLTKDENFNNKLTEVLLAIVKKNERLKEKRQGYIDDVASLQNKLMTYRLSNLSSEQKKQIDLVYDYLKAKNDALIKLLPL